MPTDANLLHRVFGTPGAERLVVLVGTGAAVTLDPLPAETAARDVTVLAVALGADTMAGPGGHGSETPAEQTAQWLADLVRDALEVNRSASGGDVVPTAGVVAYRGAVDVVLRAAAHLGDTVDRLALVAVAVPEQPLDREDIGALVQAVTAETLVMNGQRDAGAAAAAAAWYRRHLTTARVEMVPAEDALPLSSVWGRVLAHVAPRTTRR